MNRSRILRIVFTVLLVLVLAVTSVFSILFETGGTGVFLNSRQSIYELFPTDALPSFYSVYWGIPTLIWQTAWIVYSISLLCRNGSKGRNGSEVPKYLDPTCVTPVCLGLYSLGLILVLGWIFALDRNIIPLAFVLMVVALVLFVVSLSLNHKTLYQDRFELHKQNRRYDDILMRVLVQNGIASVIPWTLDRITQTMSILITYWSNPPINQETASIIALSINELLVVVLIILDITVIDIYTRYNYLQYISAVYLNNAVIDNSSTKVPAVLAGLTIASAATALAIKILLGIQRNKTDPCFPVEENANEEKSS